MLPPVEPVTLSANPQFEALYTDLTTKKLNEDGTSVLEGKAVKEREAFYEELRKSRVDSSKRDIVRNGLQDLAYRSEELPDELRELVVVVAAALGGEIAEEDNGIVEEVVERFNDNVPPIAAALSKQLHQDLKSLSDLTLNNASPPSLPQTISNLQSETLSAVTRQIATCFTLAHTLTATHTLARQIFSATIRLLEQTLHGAMARNTKARADYLCTVAEGMAKKLRVQYEQLYLPEMADGLGEMEREQSVLKRKVREGEEELERYGRMKGVESLIEEFGEILKEIKRVREEVGRLGG